MVMRAWSTSNASRVCYGDISNVSNDAWGIFLERRWRSSSERLFMNFFLYLKCFFTTGESPVTVILKSSKLNVHVDGVIQWRASIWARTRGQVLYFLLTNLVGNIFIPSVRQKNVSGEHKKRVPHLTITNHKSQNLRLWHTNTIEIWECSIVPYEFLSSTPQPNREFFSRTSFQSRCVSLMKIANDHVGTIHWNVRIALQFSYQFAIFISVCNFHISLQFSLFGV